MKPEIVIEYCAVWNYEPQAVGLAAKIMAFKLNVGAVKLIPSTGGAFEVSVNGQSVYSKQATGQFPDPDAVAADVKKLL